MGYNLGRGNIYPSVFHLRHRIRNPINNMSQHTKSNKQYVSAHDIQSRICLSIPNPSNNMSPSTNLHTALYSLHRDVCCRIYRSIHLAESTDQSTSQNLPINPPRRIYRSIHLDPDSHRRNNPYINPSINPFLTILSTHQPAAERSSQQPSRSPTYRQFALPAPLPLPPPPPPP